MFGERTPAVLRAYRAAMPGAPPGRLATAIATDHGFRMPATRWPSFARAWAPTWLYWFTWATPVLGGVLGSCHGVDIPFAFHALSVAGVEFFTGTAPERNAVADAFHGAIVDFARWIVSWPRYEPGTRAVWQVDVEPAVIHDPDPRCGSSRVGADMVDERGPRRRADLGHSPLPTPRLRRATSSPALRCLAADPPDLVVHTGDVVADDPDDEEEQAFAGILAIPGPAVRHPGQPRRRWLHRRGTDRGTSRRMALDVGTGHVLHRPRPVAPRRRQRVSPRRARTRHPGSRLRWRRTIRSRCSFTSRSASSTPTSPTR